MSSRQTDHFSSKKAEPKKSGVDQNSAQWYLQSAAHMATLGAIKAPKTTRSDNYRREYISKNPGIIFDGLYFCAYCGKPVTKSNMHVDHVKPLNRGGRNTTANMVCACARCNLKKSDKGGLWVVRGRIGKLIYTPFQIASNLLTGVFHKRKNLSSKLSKYAWIGIGIAGVAWAATGGLQALQFLL